MRSSAGDPRSIRRWPASLSRSSRAAGWSTRTRAAEARAEQARAQYEQSVLVALREASDALVGVRTARHKVAAQATQAQALRRALQLADLRYRTGIASYLEVLDAQRGLSMPSSP